MDSNNIVSHELKPPIWARYIRFHPKTWYSHISMRVEVYGCKKGTLYSASLMSLITSSTLKLLKFMGEIVFYSNLLSSGYLLAVGFKQKPKNHHKPYNICHSVSVFLENVWKIEPRSTEEKFHLLSKLVWQVLILDQSATALHKAREKRKRSRLSVTHSCFTLSEFYF